MDQDGTLKFSAHNSLNLRISIALEALNSFGTLVVTGPTGSGKSFFTRLLHDKSNRSEHPFLAVECASLAEGRFESECFGHRKGAFSGASSDSPGLLGTVGQGSLCFENLEDLGLANQAKLLRFLQLRQYRSVGATQERHYEGAVMFSSRSPLSKLLEQGLLRDDFYFRVANPALELPPIHERPEDLAIIGSAMVQRMAPTMPAGVVLPEQHHWQALAGKKIAGNLHGLYNALIQAMIAGRPLEPAMTRLSRPEEVSLPDHGSLKADLAELERRLIERALVRYPHSRPELAKFLGISLRSLHYKLARFGLAGSAE